MSAIAAASVQQKQRKKIAWLEATVDTCIVAYESHRNALENIAVQLTQWQQQPGDGCIHLDASTANELINDINDVLEQCALQLTPADDASVSTVNTPLRSQEQQQERAAPQPSQTSADSTRPTSLIPSAVAQPSRTRRAERAQSPHTPPPQLQPNAAPQYHPSPTATAPPPAQPQQPQQKQEQVRSARWERTSASTEESAPTAERKNGSPVQLDNTAQKPVHNGARDTPRTVASSTSTLPRPQQHQPAPAALLGNYTPQRSAPAARPPSTERTPRSDVRSSQPSGSASARQGRGRDRTGVALTPWPLAEDGESTPTHQEKSLIATPPSARQRAAENHDELPAAQYEVYKETGQLLQPSPLRRAAATELEERAKAEREAREDGLAGEAFGAQGRSAVVDRSFMASAGCPHRRGEARRAARQRKSESSVGGGSGNGGHTPGDAQEHELQLSALSSEARWQPSNRASRRADATPRRHTPHAQPAAAASEAGRSASRHSHAASASASAHSPQSPSQHPDHGDDEELQQRFFASCSVSQASSNAAAPHRAAAASVTAERPTSTTASKPAAAKTGASSSAPHRRRPPREEAPMEKSIAVSRGDPTTLLDASQAGSIGLVHTPTVTPQRASATEGNGNGNGNGVASHAVHHAPEEMTEGQSSSAKQLQLQSGDARGLRTSTPRRTTPRAYDSTQVQDAVYHRRLSGGLLSGKASVRPDSPEALRYMERENAQLMERREREWQEVRRDPRLAINGVDGDGNGAPLSITAGANGGVVVLNAAGKPKGALDAAALLPTALEAQLTTERTLLLTQLEKMQMEMTLAVSRHREWGNEGRYAQLNTRMTRVHQDLDRVETELRVVRNMDIKSRLQAMTSSAVLLEKVPEPWAPMVRPFLQRATEFESKEPLVSYYLRTHVAFLCMRHRKKEDKPGTAFLMTLLDALEADKKKLGDQLHGTDGRTVLTKFALMLFARADDAERTGNASVSIVRIFYTAAVLLEATAQFTEDGTMDSIALQKSKYAKYIATRMKKALDSNEAYVSPNKLEAGEDDHGADTTAGAGVGGAKVGEAGALPPVNFTTAPASCFTRPTTNATGGSQPSSDAYQMVSPPPPQLPTVAAAPQPPVYNSPPSYVPPPVLPKLDSPPPPAYTFNSDALNSKPQQQPPQQQPSMKAMYGQAPTPQQQLSSSHTNSVPTPAAVAPPPPQQQVQAAPMPTPSPGFKPSIDQMIDAQKFASHAVSALQFYDYENAKKQLVSALRILNTGK